MRLKKLIVQGFKSFADKTEFAFDAPITGIVGPNGCGKSNVVDGFKWVLGEQSAKSLRGDAMMDVIFNGSNTRKAAGMAEVTLVFENPTRVDGSRLLNLDADEVHVGRRLFRDGTSEYQLNTKASRLKDIRELFLDTGVGVDAYSVIEQGKVSAMLEANPDERRTIFEEAAGISKFKVKKKETQRKLEKTEQNLLRLNDIVEEVEKRLRSVRGQATKAKTYQEHSARLNELRLSYSLQEYHTLKSQSDELNASLNDAQFRFDDLASEYDRHERQLGEARAAHEAAASSKQQADYELVQTVAKLESAHQRQAYAEQQIAALTEQLANARRDHDLAETKLAESVEHLASERTKLTELSDEVNFARQMIDEKQIAFRDAQLELNNVNRELERHKSSVMDLMRQLSQVDNRMSAIQIERNNLAAQQQRVIDRRETLRGELTTIETSKSELQSKLEEVLQKISQQTAAATEMQSSAERLDNQIAAIGADLGSAREHRSGLLSRQQLLKDLEQRREGVSEGTKAVLRQKDEKFSFIRGIVADVLRVDVEHAFVIEAALNGADQTLIANLQSEATASHESLAELTGRVNMLCADRLASTPPLPAYDWNQHPHGIRLASDLVRFDPANRDLVRHLLGHTVVVDTIEEARELHLVAPRGYRYVTLAGEVIEPDGTLRAGPLSAAMSLLSRRSELDAINLQIADVDGRIKHLSAQLSAGNEDAAKLEEQVNQLRAELYASNTSKVQLTSQLSQVGDKLAAVNRELPVLDKELEKFDAQTARLDAEQQTLSQQHEQKLAAQIEHQTQIEKLGVTLGTLQENLKTWAEELTAARVSLGQAEQKKMSAEQAVRRLESAEAELRQHLTRLAQSAEMFAGKQGETEHELATAQRAQTTLSVAREELTERVERLTGQVTTAHAAVRDLAASADTSRSQRDSVEEELHAAQLAASENKVRLETLIARTLEESSLDLPTKYAEGYEPAEMDWAAVAEEIKDLRGKIQRLGNVNLDSLVELDDLEQRSGFYAKQLEDLNTSKLQLVELIDTINRESSVRFEQTFNAVRGHFQGMFRKLFGGGNADIYLETELEDKDANQPGTVGPDGQTVLPIMKKTIDPLEAGIEIIAKPPGKKPCSISQLSGGEKTMTCVALLMSIFKSKPSPFCILDEVDAALDEANNGRFNMIVQEFLDMSQFIIITHSKRTMQIADVLYGITQQEQGVSKRVAVKFDQVDSEGRIKQEEVVAA